MAEKGVTLRGAVQIWCHVVIYIRFVAETKAWLRFRLPSLNVFSSTVHCILVNPWIREHVSA